MVSQNNVRIEFKIPEEAAVRLGQLISFNQHNFQKLGITSIRLHNSWMPIDNERIRTKNSQITNFSNILNETKISTHKNLLEKSEKFNKNYFDRTCKDSVVNLNKNSSNNFYNETLSSIIKSDIPISKQRKRKLSAINSKSKSKLTRNEIEMSLNSNEIKNSFIFNNTHDSPMPNPRQLQLQQKNVILSQLSNSLCNRTSTLPNMSSQLAPIYLDNLSNMIEQTSICSTDPENFRNRYDNFEDNIQIENNNFQFNSFSQMNINNEKMLDSSSPEKLSELTDEGLEESCVKSNESFLSEIRTSTESGIHSPDTFDLENLDFDQELFIDCQNSNDNFFNDPILSTMNTVSHVKYQARFQSPPDFRRENNLQAIYDKYITNGVDNLHPLAHGNFKLNSYIRPNISMNINYPINQRLPDLYPFDINNSLDYRNRCLKRLGDMSQIDINAKKLCHSNNYQPNLQQNIYFNDKNRQYNHFGPLT